MSLGYRFITFPLSFAIVTFRLSLLGIITNINIIVVIIPQVDHQSHRQRLPIFRGHGGGFQSHEGCRSSGASPPPLRPRYLAPSCFPSPPPIPLPNFSLPLSICPSFPVLTVPPLPALLTLVRIVCGGPTAPPIPL